MAKLVSERQERELRRANSMKEAKEQEQLMVLCDFLYRV